MVKKGVVPGKVSETVSRTIADTKSKSIRSDRIGEAIQYRNLMG